MVIKNHLTGRRHGIIVCGKFIFVFSFLLLFSLVLWSEIWSRESRVKQVMGDVPEKFNHFIARRLGNLRESFEPVQDLSNSMFNNKSNGRASCDSDEPSYRRSISWQDLLENKTITPREICRCGLMEEDIPKNRMYTESMCSAEATLRGRNQSVISFSLFAQSGSKGSTAISRFLPGVKANYDLMGQLYPGWIMRVYTNISFTPQMCDVVCSGKDLFFCDVRQLPDLGNVEDIHPMTWRFLPLGDPTVSKFLVRDLDSRLNQREKDAVDHWLKSKFPFHGMRDHPLHGTYIMGGMWGADNERSAWKFLGINDQEILNLVIYSRHRKKILTHDSYLCARFGDSIPFPTRRLNLSSFVGSVFPQTYNYTVALCPMECRPVFGKDWDYC